MQQSHLRRSPHGRAIRVRQHQQVVPTWVRRRRRADRLIDVVAVAAKRAIRRLVPRPHQTKRAHLAGTGG